MAYNKKLANRIREALAEIPSVEGKKMFGGLAFMVNGKMCINASGENLMCRFDPALQKEISKRKGYKKMIMGGREYKGYCYVKPEGFKTKKEFEYWIRLCIDYNKKVKTKPKRKKR
ncbi:TfoX/Sxy family protein [bacterium BMS3Abin03]|jgi:TfoX/Sxy family transcriptional regulator of competence genes|nr:TfoX/Sxy family protein [bacterium BMS3Abin03]